MTGEIRNSPRCSVLLEISRRSTDNGVAGSKPSGGQVQVRHIAYTHGRVPPLFDKIDPPVREAEIDGQGWMALEKIRDYGSDLAYAE